MILKAISRNWPIRLTSPSLEIKTPVRVVALHSLLLSFTQLMQKSKQLKLRRRGSVEVNSASRNRRRIAN